MPDLALRVEEEAEATADQTVAAVMAADIAEAEIAILLLREDTLECPLLQSACEAEIGKSALPCESFT